MSDSYYGGSRNSGRLPDKSGSNYHLAGSVDVKMSGKNPTQKTYLCKMNFFLFGILKQLPAFVLGKL